MTVLATLEGGVISKWDNAVWLLSIKADFSYFTEIKFLHPLWFLLCCQHPTLSWSQSSLISCDYLGKVSRYVYVGLAPECIFFPAYSSGVSRSSFREPINMYIVAKQIKIWSSHTRLLPPASLETCLQCNPTVSFPFHMVTITKINYQLLNFFTECKRHPYLHLTRILFCE